jgi:gliding motility-associated-like protein
MHKEKLLITFLLIIILPPIFVRGQLVPTGAGSYTTTFPLGPYSLGMDNLHYYPGDDYNRTGTRQPKVVPGWTGPIPANKWWSSAIWNYETSSRWLIAPYSFMMHPHPLIIGATRYGLRMTYEDNPVVNGTDYIYYREPHIYVGIQGMDIPASIGLKVKSYSDWAMTMRWDDAAGKSLEATSGHGFPFVYFTKTGGDVTLRFQVAPITYANINNGTIVARGVTVLGKNYGIFMPAGTSFGSTYALPNNEADVPKDSVALCCVNRDAYNAKLPAGQNYFSMAILPDNSAATLAYYAQYAFSFITDTKTTYTYNEATNKIVSTFTASTTPQGTSTETGTLLALYRHQWKHTTNPLTAYQYKSARGVMKVYQGTSYTTQMTNNGFLPSMPNAYNNKGQMYTYVDNEFKKPYLIHFPDKQPGYFAGKNLQRVANLIEIAHQAKHFAARDTFRAYAKRYIQFWFDASGGKNEQLFYYDAKWNSLTAYPSAFESDRQLNDHHFGYGYFVKTAATIARFESNNTWVNQWGPMVEMLIKDVADWNRNDPQFPYLRNFDSYAGHSWASGHANFKNGNNQESGSESLNFASGLALWGLATGNATLRDLGIYMYTTEETAVRQYWFDEDKAVFPPGFTSNFGSLIWGWGAEYNTWFAPDPEHVQGISYLPVTGSSLYLGYNPPAAAANYANLVSRTGSTTQTTDFKDVIWEYQALSDPATAKSKFLAAGNYTPEGGETRAHTLHWISNLDSMGVVDTSVIADMASFAVFKKGGCKHYVVYNPPVPFNHTCVNYSDGNSWRLPKADSIYVFKKCPVTTVIPTYTVCKGQKIRLAANDSLQGKGNYIWDFNGGASIVGARDSVYSSLAVSSGQYHVKYGCTFTKGDTFNVVLKDTLSYTTPVYTCSGGKFNVSYTITGGSGNAINYSISGVNASAGVTFSNVGNTFTSTFMMPGPYEFLLKDNVNNCTQYTLKGDFNKNPDVTLGKDTVLCKLASLKLDAGPGASYLWSDAETTRAITVNAAGTYSVKVTDVNGCSNKASITLKPVAAPVILNYKETCNGSSTYTVTFDISNGDAASYQVLVNGSGPGGGGTLSGSTFTSGPVPSGSAYSFIVKDKYACTPNSLSGSKNCACQTNSGSMSGSLVNVCETNKAIVAATVGPNLDPDDALMYYLHNNNGSALGTVYASNTLPEFTYLPQLTYGVTYYISAVAGNKNGSGGIDITDPCLSVSKGTPVIFNAKPTAATSGSQEICMGSQAFISVSLTGNAPWNLTYSDGTKNTAVASILINPYTFSVNSAGTYTVTAVSDSFCTGSVFTGNAVITDAKHKNAKISVIKPSCSADAPFKLNAVDTGGVWTGKGISSSSKGIFSPVISGVGTVKIKYTINGNCYSDSDTVSVKIFPVPFVNLGKDSSICEGDSIRLNIDKNYSGLWQDGSKSNSYLVKTPGAYFVTAGNGYCSVIDSITFTRECPFSLYVPSAFTPNNDGNNDVFMAKGENVFDYELAVYNRWGERFFTSNDINKGWDGKNDLGKESPIDVYVYYLKYSSHSKNTVIHKYSQVGRFALIR